jgi:hypothetical protein
MESAGDWSKSTINTNHRSLCCKFNVGELSSEGTMSAFSRIHCSMVSPFEYDHELARRRTTNNGTPSEGRITTPIAQIVSTLAQ